MNLSRFIFAVAFAAAVPLLGSCDRDQAVAKVDAKAVQQAQDQLAQPAWLRAHLPAHTVAYLRIPSPWSVIGGVPDGRPLDAATASAANLKAVAAIRTAMGKDPVLADSGVAAYLLPLLVDMRSPLEAAAVDALGFMSPNSQVLVSMRVAQHTPAEINARFARLDTAAQLAVPLNAAGDGQLVGGTPLHFDSKNQRLFALAGVQTADAARLASILADMTKSASDDSVTQLIAAQEAHIDQSGEGLFGWVSVHGLGGMAAGASALQALGSLPGDLISKADSVAFGAGSVDGHGRIQVRLYAPKARLLDYLAPRQFDPAFKVAGTPRWVVNLALPAREQWQQVEKNLLLDFGPNAAAPWHEAMTTLKTKAGFDLNDLGAWIGPELVGFDDDAGSYAALRVRDRKALYAFVEQRAKQHHWRYRIHKLNGVQIHALSATSASLSATDAADAQSQLISRIGTHLYWIEDGDFLIFARVPQALADRAAAHPDTLLSDWLTHQGYPGEHSLLGVLARTQDAQRHAYYSYLQILQILSDISGVNTDLFDMPAAHALNLPKYGVAGANIGVGVDTVSFSLNYEQQPLELIGAGNGGGTTTIAAVGILAAIAVPAYQDYTIRAQVSEGFALASATQTAMIEYQNNHDRWPTNHAQIAQGTQDTSQGVYVESVDVLKNGAIRIKYSATPPFKANTALAGKTVLLQAEPTDDGSWSWQCSSSEIKTKWLPASCR